MTGESARLRIGRVFAGSGRCLRQQWRPLLVLSVLVEIPVFVTRLFVHDHGVLHIEIGDRSPVLEVGWALLALTFYTNLAHHLLVGVIERLVGAEREGHLPPRLGSLVRTLPWGALIAADLLLTVAITVGVVLFIVPGVVLAVWFAFVPVILSFERPAFFTAFRSSRELVRGSFWPLLTVLAVTWIAGGVIADLLGAGLSRLVEAHLAEVLAHTLPSALLAPALAVPTVVAMFDLRAAKGLAPARPSISRRAGAGDRDAREPI